MVFKYLTKCEVCHGEQAEAVFRDQWNFVGGITNASIYYDEGCKSVVAALEFESRLPIRIAVPYEAYLLNDNGKTIERVRG